MSLPTRTWRRILAGGALAVCTLAAAPSFAIVNNSPSPIDTDANGLGLQGYDPVAYFTAGAATLGDPKFQAKHNGATYYFASAEDLQKFKANPEAYLPRYGGFCAMGTAHGIKLEGDPHVWKVVDDKLYVNVNPDVGRAWLQNIPGNIAKANDNWPKIKDKTPSDLQPH
ncbi:MAG: YHS domain-containing (seleno)protein [Caulobacteraceae bacterium]